MKLQEIFLIKNMNIDSEECQAIRRARDEFGKLKEKVVATFVSEVGFNLNFNNGFSFNIKRSSLQNAFDCGVKLEDTVRILEKNIKKQYMSEICK